MKDIYVRLRLKGNHLYGYSGRHVHICFFFSAIIITENKIESFKETLSLQATLRAKLTSLSGADCFDVFLSNA